MKTVLIACSMLAAAPALAADEDVVEIESDQDRVGRVAAELGAGLLGAALPQLLWLPFVAMPTSQSGPLQFMLVTAASLTPLAAATSVWLVHRRLKGQGYWAGAFGGAMFGTVLGLSLIHI